MKTSCSDVGYLPAITVATLAVFYLIWAAMHDIAQGGIDRFLEFIVLAACVPALVCLYRLGLSYLVATQKVVWLGGLGMLVALLDASAVAAIVHPKYAADPALGAMLLAVGLPLLALVTCRLFRETRRIAAMRKTQ